MSEGVKSVKICPECETSYDSESCPECECSRRFFELENKQLRLEDELSERLSDLQFAKERIKPYEKAVQEAKNRLRENEVALRDFKWWTATN